MSNEPLPQIALSPADDAAGAVVAWSLAGKRYVTVVVKATFAFVPEGPMRPLPVEAIVASDVHFGNNPARSARLSSDLAPYLRRADVLLTGHAHAPQERAVDAVHVRLGVAQGGKALIDKTLLVREEPGRSLQRVALVYENAYGGAGWNDNPFGVGADGAVAPRIVDPAAPKRTVGFGPIAATWPSRRRLRPTTAAARASVLALPENVDWSFYQAAPADQQIGYLRGDEWILLEGMHPELASVRSYLPRPRPEAWIHGRSASFGAEAIPLVADTLRIDADALSCSLVWRGNVEVPQGVELGALRILAGVALPDRPIVWPEQAPPPAQARVVEAASTVADDAPTLVYLPEGPGSAPAPAPAPAPASASASVSAPASVSVSVSVSASVSASAMTLALSEEAAQAAVTAPVMPFATSTAAPVTQQDKPATPAPVMTFVLSEAASEAAGEAPATPFVDAPRTPATPAPPAPKAPPPKPAGPSAGLTLALSDPAAIAAQHAAVIPFLSSPTPAERPPAPVEALPSADTPPPALDGGRTIDAIPIVHKTPLAGCAMVWAVKPPASALVVILKGTFDLVPGAAATITAEPEPLTGDLHHDDDPQKSLRYPSDFAILKPCADVMLLGHAHAPGGMGPAAEVQFNFGREGRGFRRRIAAFGERRWQRALIRLAPTEPQPFEKIALVYENAFGGAGYGDNPVGLGRSGERLPLLEDPASLIRAPGDAPRPACFGPIAAVWPERWSKLGTYDARWRKGRWPHFPEDFDGSYFQAAPRAQQLEPLDGDEPFELVGMRPDQRRLTGSLPGLRVRAFAQQREAAGGALQEIALKLDTALFDADAMKLTLVWRGLLPVADQDASDVVELYAMTEPLAEPRATLEEVQRRYLAARAELSIVEEEPDAEGPAAPANDADPPEDPREAEEDARLDAELAAHEQRLRAELAAQGISADAPKLPKRLGKRRRPPSPEAVARRMRKAGLGEAQIAAVLKEMEPPAPDVPEPEVEEPSPRARAIAMLEADEPFEDTDFAGADLSGLDFSGRSLARANLKEAKLRGCKLARANLGEAQLGGADLGEAQLDEAVLEGADLTGARLEGASLEGARLDGADFSEVRAAKASFRKAHGEGAMFVKGDLAGARFEEAMLPGADFTGAALDRASFERAELLEAHLFDVRAVEARFDGATLEDVSADGATLRACSLRGVRASRSVWEGAVLDGSDFLGSVLTGASFVKASCQKARFGAVDLVDARLGRARLSGCVLLEANLMRASLERADLRGADLRGSNLYAAETSGARLDGAMLDQAIVGKTRLEGGIS